MSENKTKDEILELVKLVDHNFEVHWFDVLFRGGMGFPFTMLLIFLVLIEVIMFTVPTYERIVVGLSFTAVILSYFSLMSHFVEESLVNVNFKRFGMCVEENRRPLLKALIKMKVKHQKIDLEQIYSMNEDLFSTQKLLEKLYE